MNKNLLENNFIVIKNFISKESAIKLADDYKFYCSEISPSGDDQAPSSNSVYNYFKFAELLCEKTKEVSEILGEPVLPTYAYSRIYYNGSVLKKHRDRDACEISLTVHLDGDNDWPIYIKSPSGEKREVILKPGDAMMYLGTVADHWRDVYIGEYYTQVFIHYVRSRGNCSYAYFDKLKSKSKDSTSFDLKFPKEFIFTGIKEMNPKATISPLPDNTLEKYIEIFENAIPEELCDEILEEYSDQSEWLDSLVRDKTDDLSRKIRNCKQIDLSKDHSIEINKSKREKIDRMIFDCVSKVVNKYSNIHQYFMIETDTGFNLLKYDEGGFYTQHVDSYKNEQRSISCSLQLNDDYEGGEFSFFDRKLKYKSKKGSAIIFPSNFMYPHEIMPIIKGTRYSIVTWLV